MVKKITKEVKVTTDMAMKYVDLIERFMPEFEKIAGNGNEEGVYLAASTALRIAAKIAAQYGGSRSGFIVSAGNNFDLEMQKEADLMKMRLMN